MDTKRIVIGTIVGAVTLHITGYLIFEVALAGFYAANVGAATNVFKIPTLQWALAVGNLSLAALVTLCIANRAGAATIGEGLLTGAVVGFLVWFGVDFVLYGSWNALNLTATIVDPLLGAIQYGIAGAVIAAVLARVPKSAAA